MQICDSLALFILDDGDHPPSPLPCPLEWTKTPKGENSRRLSLRRERSGASLVGRVHSIAGLPS